MELSSKFYPLTFCMKNPKWHRDEIILALDLYFQSDRGSIDHRNPKIIELSKILNELPIFSSKPDKEKFRNTNGVTLKLSNFLPFDDTYNGRGMTRGSKLDAQIFKEFVSKRDELRSIASEIRKLVENAEIRDVILSIEEDEQTSNDSVSEGAILYKWHKAIERNAKIVKQKKEHALAKCGSLICEVCDFDFAQYYGDLGIGFIECHHKIPLAKIKTSTKTSLDDLALICANCHRIIHRNINILSIKELKCIIRNNR